MASLPVIREELIKGVHFSGGFLTQLGWSVLNKYAETFGGAVGRVDTRTGIVTITDDLAVGIVQFQARIAAKVSDE